MAFGLSATCGPHMGRQPFTELSHIRIPYKVHISATSCFHYLAHSGLGYGTVLVQFWLKRYGPVLGRQTRTNLGHTLAVDLGQIRAKGNLLTGIHLRGSEPKLQLALRVQLLQFPHWSPQPLRWAEAS